MFNSTQPEFLELSNANDRSHFRLLCLRLSHSRSVAASAAALARTLPTTSHLGASTLGAAFPAQTELRRRTRDECPIRESSREQNHFSFLLPLTGLLPFSEKGRGGGGINGKKRKRMRKQS